MAASRDLLVQRVNEIYHDALNQDYSHTFRDIETTERDRWLRAAQRFLVRAEPTSVIEIGTGTGFVPLTAAPLLKPGDHWCCSDISEGVLSLAREQLNSAGLPCDFEFKKLSAVLPYKLPWPDASADVVLMNSVLHHLENTPEFLAEIARITRPQGLLIIGHEPNSRFQKNAILRLNFFLFDWIFNLRLKMAALGRRTGTLQLMRRFYYLLRPGKRSEMGQRGQRMDEIYAAVNAQLKTEGLIDHPLKSHQIDALVDVHADEGFDPEALLSGYHVEMLETYNHLLTVSSFHSGNRFVQWVDARLAGIWPRDGAIFFAAYRKP